MLNLYTIDLHGHTVADGMSRFVSDYNRVLRDGRFVGIEVIHGKGRGGEGVIRDALRALLRASGPRIKGFDAQLVMRGAEYLLDMPGNLVYLHGEDATHNGGCTIVFPRQRLHLPPEYRY
ncbi:MAG TPA: Smr/MutS family protein [Chloroflexia bacterium]|nr:Smr/MutS family protein [Chloroflexia bacterium]